MNELLRDVFQKLSDFGKSYLLRAPNGLRLAAYLAIAYIGLQGIKVVSSLLNVEVSFLGVDSIPGAWLFRLSLFP